MDWELRACSRKGHLTYRPDEQEYARALTVHTRQGEAWRCLRCGDYVVGDPRGSGPADQAPLPLRGRALRDATVLRLLAAERIIRALLIILLGYAVLRFKSSENSLNDLFNRALPAAKPLARVFNVDLDTSPTILHLRNLLHAKPGTLTLVASLLLGYAAIQIVEGIGLWLLKRWGEYFATVATSLFLPLEIYELTEKITVLRILALLVNVAAVIYLLLSKRLFGLRGGKEAYEAERESQSLLEVKESAEGDDEPAGEPAGAAR